MIRFFFTMCAFATLTCQIAYADLVITIGNSVSSDRASTPSFQAGNVVTLGLYIHNSRDIELSAADFTLGFDLSLPGAANFYDGHNGTLLKSLFSDFTITPVAAGNGSISNDVASSDDSALGYDVSIDFGATNSIEFASRGNQNSATHIANISFKSASNAPGGTYGFKFNPNASFPDGSAFNFVTGDLALAAGQDGSSFNRFSLSAVPEPSSLALGASVLFVLESIRRFRRKNSKDGIAV